MESRNAIWNEICTLTLKELLDYWRVSTTICCIPILTCQAQRDGEMAKYFTYREKFSSCKFSWTSFDFEELDRDIELQEFASLEKLSSSAEFHPIEFWSLTAFLLFTAPLPDLITSGSFMISWDSSLCTSAQWMLQMRLGELGEGGGFFLNILKNFMLSDVGCRVLTGLWCWCRLIGAHPSPSAGQWGTWNFHSQCRGHTGAQP